MQQPQQPAGGGSGGVGGGGGGTPSMVTQVFDSFRNLTQRLLDQSVPHVVGRWIALFSLLLLYGYRVYSLQGFYIVTYGLGIFLLNLLIGFLTPLEEDLDGPSLPTSNSDAEFKPFIRRLPEFKFWHSSAKAVLIAFFMTFFSAFNIPVFWPILLIYFIVLFVLTMKRQIKHMIKHKYLPFSIGKKTYGKQNQTTILRPSSLGLGSVVGGGGAAAGISRKAKDDK